MFDFTVKRITRQVRRLAARPERMRHPATGARPATGGFSVHPRSGPVRPDDHVSIAGDFPRAELETYVRGSFESLKREQAGLLARTQRVRRPTAVPAAPPPLTRCAP
ncbi:hypothetical protein ACGH2B_05435 [Streptomyces sp. BBFR2]|uniref:hypothetical protein n=1 Tax=Streptomyces sp. BBFR2 TaxID=3372854 RepID=UPI0037D9CFA3